MPKEARDRSIFNLFCFQGPYIMKRILFALVCLVAVSTTAVGAEGSKASTKKLPAALRALGGAQVLSRLDAAKIRGEGSKSPAIKFPGNKYTGYRTGQDLKPGYGGLK